MKTFISWKAGERAGVIIEALKAAGVEYRETRHEILAFPSTAEEWKIVNASISAQHRFGVELAESGAGRTSTGFGRVVAGSEGERLKPYRRVRFCGGPHAYFSVRTFPAYYVAAVQGRRNIVNGWKITEPVEKDGVWRAGSEEIFQSESVSEIPERYQFLREAATEAWKKARCYHCRESHYVAE
jgi:hypothetical protein